MILFVVCQIAGAEYLYPLVQQDLGVAWEILASPVCGQYLEKRGIPHRVLESVTLEQARAIVNELKPAKALIGASSRSALEQNFVVALQEQGIPVMQFLDVWTNYSARFQVLDDQGGMRWLLPDKILTIDEASQAAMIAEGLPAGIISIVGQPYLEMLAERYRSQERLIEPRKTLLSTQPISKFYGKKLGYDEIDFVRCCCEAWRISGNSWNDLEAGVHPSEQTSAYEQLQQEFAGLSIRSGAGDLTGYCRVLGMFSSVLIQGILAGCEVASVQPGAVGADACYLPASISRFHHPEALANWLNGTVATGTSASYREGIVANLSGSRARIVSLLQGDPVS